MIRVCYHYHHDQYYYQKPIIIIILRKQILGWAWVNHQRSPKDHTIIKTRPKISPLFQKHPFINTQFPTQVLILERSNLIKIPHYLLRRVVGHPVGFGLKLPPIKRKVTQTHTHNKSKKFVYLLYFLDSVFFSLLDSVFRFRKWNTWEIYIYF